MKEIAFTIFTIFFLILGVQSAYAGLDDGLVAYYPFNGNANDESGNGNHGTVHGATLTEDMFGNANSAYSFNGTGDHISIPVNINPGLMRQLTMTAWARADNDSPIRQVISHDNGGYDRSMGIDYRGGGTGWSAFSGTGAVLGYHPVEVGEWVFLVVVYDQDTETVTLYVNDSSYEEMGSLGSGLDYTLIGSNPFHGEYFQGAIDDIRVYDRALSEDEIQQLFNQPAIVNPDYHDFDIIEIGCVASEFFTVENISKENLEISVILIEGENADEFYLPSDNCSGTTLEPDETCVFGVEFEPESLGSKVASANISFTDTELEPHEVPLAGLVTEVCECNLNDDNDCNGIDWLLFYPDWGRNDCNDPGVECECDLNEDGTCNGLDWLLFYPDWGRDDCPVCP
jgi:hypothetical protein